jgi:hypothetical protein
MRFARAANPVARRGHRFGALSTIALVLLAGCTSNGTTPSTTSTEPSTVAGQSTIATTIPFSITKNARQDVTAGSCRAVGGFWVLSGTLTNSAKKARAYQIVVDFVDRTGNTVLGTKIVTTPSIRPGAGSSWSAKSTSGLTNVACVIRQVQAPA